MENLKVIDNKERRRFEIDLEGKVALIDYIDRDGVVAMTHTEVPPEFEGKGVGSQLVKGALEIVKNDGKRVQPLCTFVIAYIKRHPEYNSIVA